MRSSLKGSRLNTNLTLTYIFPGGKKVLSVNIIFINNIDNFFQKAPCMKGDFQEGPPNINNEK